MIFTGLGHGLLQHRQPGALWSAPCRREYRGFATGMVQTVFGVGSLLGISLAGTLMSVAFRVLRGGWHGAEPGGARALRGGHQRHLSRRARSSWLPRWPPRSCAAGTGSRQHRAWAEGRYDDRDLGCC